MNRNSTLATAAVILALGAGLAAMSLLQDLSWSPGKVTAIAGITAGLLSSVATTLLGGRLFRAEKERMAAERLGVRRSADSVHLTSRRDSLADDLLNGARIDDLKAPFALSLIPIVVIGGAVLTGYFDGGPAPADGYALAYALVKRLGFLGVTFYLAHAAVSQYRYSTLRAAHYRACAQALRVCDDDATLVTVYRMLLPPHAFGTAPTSPVDALVKIAQGKESKD